MHKIASRYSNSHDFSETVTLRLGMCISSRVNDEGKIINSSLPYPDFVYIVTEINKESIYLIDTAHNNSWSIKPAELDCCELVGEHMQNNDQIDCDYVNKVLTGFYNK